MTRILTLACSCLALALGLAACGEKEEPSGAGSGGEAAKLRVMLDYFPNADHAGLYAAQAAGDLRRRGARRGAHAAARPVGAAEAPAGGEGRRRDLLRARAAARARGRRGPRLRRRARAEAADVADVGGQGRRSARRPGWRASASGPQASRTSPPTWRRSCAPRVSTRARSRRPTSASTSCPRCSRGASTRRWARSGTTRGRIWSAARRTRRSCAWRSWACRPTPSSSSSSGGAISTRTSARSSAGSSRPRARGTRRCATIPRPGIDALLEADPGLDRGLQEAVVDATLPVFFPEDESEPWGWQDPEEWQAYIDWMVDEELLTQPQTAERVLTNEFLPGEGLDPRSALEQD